MANSLLDQLQKSGLVDDKKVKQAVKAKRKQEKIQRNSKQPAIDDTKLQAAQAKAEKAAKDKELNQQRNEKAQRKAFAAQIKQLIEINTIEATGEQPFNFTDGKHIKRIYVDLALIGRLSRGVVAIVKLGDKYILVPSPVAERIAERDPERIIFKADKNPEIVEEDDPYADYKIPDDLMW
ncbi:MAG: DUF2058 domain-containing protein [Porticoccaceae bacterium]|nr:DUF2058 domain-containing protein [Porticoccaceae bacterium]